MKHLDLSGNRFLKHDELLKQVFDQNWSYVCLALTTFASNNQNLVKLNLSRCQLGDQGAAALF